MHLLYVEDHVGFRTAVIREYLAPHQVTVASSLAEARKLLANTPFDAVLLDYDLPDGKGPELMEDIARCGLSGQVVAISSNQENNINLIAAGASAAVSKMEFSGIGHVLDQLSQ